MLPYLKEGDSKSSTYDKSIYLIPNPERIAFPIPFLPLMETLSKLIGTMPLILLGLTALPRIHYTGFLCVSYDILFYYKM